MKDLIVSNIEMMESLIKRIDIEFLTENNKDRHSIIEPEPDTITMKEEEFKEMTEKLKSNETTIAELQQQHHVMTTSNESLQHQLDAMTLKYEELTASLTSKEAEHQRTVERLQAENERLKDRVQSVDEDRKEQNEGMRTEWKKAMEEVGSLKAQLSEKRVMIEDKVLEMSDLTIKYEESLELLRSNESEWEKQKAQMVETANGEQKEMEERHRKEVDTLNERMEQREEEVESIKVQYKALERVVSELKKENRELSMVVTSPPDDGSASQCYLSNITMAKWFK